MIPADSPAAFVFPWELLIDRMYVYFVQHEDLFESILSVALQRKKSMQSFCLRQESMHLRTTLSNQHSQRNVEQKKAFNGGHVEALMSLVLSPLSYGAVP